MKSSVFVPHLDPVIMNHYLLANRCSFAMVNASFLYSNVNFFFLLGGLLTNSDYGQRPFCFDSCHLTDHHHSVSSSSGEKTTPNCFQIELLPPSPSEQMTFPTSLNESIINQTSNASLSASAISIISFAWSSILLKLCTFFFILRRLIGRQEFSYF